MRHAGYFVAAHGLLSSCGMQVFSSLVVARGLQGMWALLLWCEVSRARGLCGLPHAGSLVEVRRLSCPAACGILVP